MRSFVKWLEEHGAIIANLGAVIGTAATLLLIPYTRSFSFGDDLIPWSRNLFSFGFMIMVVGQIARDRKVLREKKQQSSKQQIDPP